MNDTKESTSLELTENTENRISMKFSKYHALGNDYIIINPADIPNGQLDSDQIIRICHRNYGIGSDGLLLGPIPGTECDFGLRIFNPDGGEAEKSGNGLRIFSRYLWDNKQVENKPFSIFTIGGHVKAQILQNGRTVKVEMGKAEFISSNIPVSGPSREVSNEKIIVDSEEVEISAASIGNPHCVIIGDSLSVERTKTLGPKVETHAMFPNRINVQFMKIIDRQNIQIEIWERGAGYMPGGIIDIGISPDFLVTMTGGVTKVSNGEISNEIFNN